MKITLEAGLDQTLSLVGNNFLYKAGLGDIKVKLLENNSSVIEDSVVEVGEQLVGGNVRFEQVVIKNLHESTQTIEFQVGSFRRESTREGASVNVVSTPALVGLDDLEDVTVAAGVATLLIDADINRREVLITSLSENSDVARIGSVNVAANRGIPLAVGSFVGLTTSAAVYCFDASPDSFAITEIGF
jgi:hypothetical protein